MNELKGALLPGATGGSSTGHIETRRRWAERSLEDLVNSGASQRDENGDSRRVTVFSAPVWLHYVIVHLKREHAHLPTCAAVERLTTKLGFVIVEAHPSVAAARIAQSNVYHQANILAMGKAHTGPQFVWRTSESTVLAHKFSCSVFNWVHGGLSELAQDLGSPLSQWAAICMVAAISRSELWVPGVYRKIADDEYGAFEDFMESEVKRLKQLL